jgi:hypothetical protein
MEDSMGQYNNPDFLFTYDAVAVPSMMPASGRAKLWEMEEDNAYLNYLYPKITKQIREFVEDACDKLEYEGSLMFDAYPDKTSLRRLAAGIEKEFLEKYPDYADNYGDGAAAHKTPILRDLIEVVLFHEIMYRRNRYRNHKRLYL